MRAVKGGPKVPADFVNPHAESIAPEIRRIKRIKGQLEGVERMIAGKRHCYEIVHQLRSAAAAMRALEGAVLDHHAEHLFAEVLKTKGAAKKAKAKSDLLDFLRGRLIF
jgi:DNA-binding FrmR family transcriptional regulator